MNSLAAKAGGAISIVTSVVLAVVVTGTAMYVLPVYMDVYAGAGWPLPLPVRMTIGLGHPALLLIVLAAVCGFLLYRLRGQDAPAARLSIGIGANLVLTLVFVAQVWVLLDFAIRMPAHGPIGRSAAPPAAVDTSAARPD